MLWGMSAKDVFHNAVKNALQKEGWIITDDPFFIRFGGINIYIDLGAEKVIAAEKDGKIWIQHDGTEIGIANQLVELGIPKSDIVLAFHSPFKRQFTEFAVG
jgi:hypothetical protein